MVLLLNLAFPVLPGWRIELPNFVKGGAHRNGHDFLTHYIPVVITFSDQLTLVKYKF